MKYNVMPMEILIMITIPTNSPEEQQNKPVKTIQTNSTQEAEEYIKTIQPLYQHKLWYLTIEPQPTVSK